MLRNKHGFCDSVNVHETVINRIVLYKHFVSTENNIQVPKHFMAFFLKNVVMVLTIRVRIKFII